MRDYETIVTTIGKRIKKLRETKNLTQAQLSDMVNMEDSAVRRIESGRTNPTIKTLCKFCEAFEISLEELIKPEED
jgi:transcriptional regulator with XRE-family HTH domain